MAEQRVTNNLSEQWIEIVQKIYVMGKTQFFSKTGLWRMWKILEKLDIMFESEAIYLLCVYFVWGTFISFCGKVDRMDYKLKLSGRSYLP